MLTAAVRVVGIFVGIGEQTFTANFAIRNERIEQMARKNDRASANPNTSTAALHIALPIVVGRGDEADMASRCDPVKRLVGCGRYGVKLAPETRYCPNRRTDS